MKTEFRDMDAASCEVAGIFVEYRDCLGNTLGQAVYFDWQARPLPNLGDSLACLATSPARADRRKLQGRVISRHFDVQSTEDGAEQVWVRLDVEVASTPPTKRPRGSFSDN
jgi:hypothetical protein